MEHSAEQGRAGERSGAASYREFYRLPGRNPAKRPAIGCGRAAM